MNTPSLADTFLEVRPGFSPANLEFVLRELCDEAMSVLPNLRTSRATFVRFIAERVPPSMSVADDLRNLAVGDLFVAHGCDVAHPEALRVLHALVEAVRPEVRRVNPVVDFVHEVEAHVISTVLVGQLNGGAKKILDYTGRGPLAAWLRAVAIGAALNVLRKRRAAKESDLAQTPEEALPVDTQNPEFEYLQARCGREFRLAFQTSLAQLSSRERNVLRLRYVDGLTVDEVAGLYRIHRATVLRWSEQINRRLLDQTRTTLSKNLSLPQPELDSLLNNGRAGLDVSMSGLLRLASLEAAKSSDDP